MSKPLRIGFIHPDLGIGGAERLVVDAAVSLKRLGHEVVMFTSRHDPERCFVETKDGTLPVHVLGSSIPRYLHPEFPLTILFSILRSLLLTTLLITSLLFPGDSSPVNPLTPLDRFDVFIVDQQAVSIPLLRLFSGTRVVFYCHFPDKLLSGGWHINVTEEHEVVQRVEGPGGVGTLKQLYRWPIDKLEEFTTGQADIILSNSNFSSRVFALAFPSLATKPRRVVYPCIDIDAYQSPSEKGKGKRKENASVNLISSDKPTIISFNRFEAKKNVALAIKAFAKLRDDKFVSPSDFSQLRLVIGGGYDPEEKDNVETLDRLNDLCERLRLPYHTIPSSTSSSPIPSGIQIIFLLNFSNAQRTHLLTSPSTIGLAYTPTNEHFGIVPIEAAAAGLPIVACDTGGPVETVVDFSLPQNNGKGSGILRKPLSSEWASAFYQLLSLPPSQRVAISSFAKNRAREMFSLDTLGKNMEKACTDAVNMGDIHQQVGDRLIWSSLGLMAASVGGLAFIWAVWGI